MATLRYDGKTVELAEDWRLGELIEAENTLAIDMETARGGAKMALVVYISMRRATPDMQPAEVANVVLSMNLSALATDDADDEEGQAPLGADDRANSQGEETERLPTTGLRTSGRSA